MGTLIILIGLAIAGAQQSSQIPPPPVAPPSPPYVEQTQKQFSFYPGGRIEITATVPGNVKVIGWQRSSILVQMERIVFNQPPDKAQELLAAFPVQVRWTQVLATVKAAGPPKTALANLEVNLTVYVPKTKTDVIVKMLQGDLGIGQLNGWIEATLTEGSIEARSLSGYVSAVTQRGDIFAEMADKHWEGHSFTAVTHQGTVELRLPLQFSAALQMETRDGALKIEYPMQEIDGQDTPLTAVAKKNGHSLKATVGDGGPPVSLLTHSGNLSLISKALP
jgi:hypothetical protein